MLPGLAAALVLAAIWVVLTAWSGATYHLAPPLAAVAPGFVTRMNGSVAPVRRLGVLSFLFGVGTAAAGWALIVALGIEPSAVLFENQPGGVPGEVAAGALLGGAVGAALAVRAPGAPSTNPRGGGRAR